MAMPDSDSDNALARSTHEINTLFVDTNLDTHLAMIVSGTDTVSDLKKKILSEHPHCFPDFGEVKIHALKVKRKGYYYHLSDSMFIKSAFEGVKKGWFLSVDASSLKLSNSAKSQPDLLCTIKTPSDERNHHLDASPSRNLSLLDTSLPQPGSIQYINQEVPSTKTNVRTGSEELSERCVETRDMTVDDNVHCNGLFIEASTSNPTAEKKRKRKENKTSLSGFSEEILNQMARTSEKTTEDEQKNTVMEDKHKTTATNSDNLFTEFPEHIHLAASKSRRKNQKKKKKNLTGDQVVTNETSFVSDVGEVSFKGNMDCIANDLNMASDAAMISEQNIQHSTLLGPVEVSQVQKQPEPVQEAAVWCKIPSSSLGTDVCRSDAASTKGKSDAPEVGTQTGLNVTKISRKHDSNNLKEFLPQAVPVFANLKEDSTQSGHENIVSDNYKAETNLPGAPLYGKHDYLCQDEPHVHSEEPVVLANTSEANNAVETGRLGSTRMKKRAMKPVAVKQVTSSTEHADNSARDISSTAPYSSFDDHSNEETKEGESMLSQAEREKISKQKTEDTSYKGTNGENVVMIGNEAESSPFTQENRTAEIRKKKSVAVKQITSSTEHADNSARDISVTAPYSSFSDRLNEETKKEESMLSRAKRIKISKQKTVDASSKGANEENVVMSINEAEPLPFTQENRTTEKRKKKSVAAKQVMSSTEHADNSARDISLFAPSSSFDHHSNKETKKEESMLAQAERNKISKQKSVDTSYKGANGENVVLSGNEADSLPFSPESRTKEKRKKKSVAAKQVMSSTEHADNSARDISSPTPYSSFKDHPNEETKKEESMLAQAERNKISKQKTVDTSYKGGNGDNVVRSINEADSLPLSPESRTTEKRKKKSVAAKQVRSSTEHADNSARDISSAAHYSSFKDHPNEETKKEESMLAQAERNKISKQKTVDTSYKGGNGDNVVRSVNEADSLPFSPESRTTEKRNKKSVAAKQVRSSTEHADNSARDISFAAHYSSFKDHPNEETKKEESMLAQAERNEISKQKTVDISYKGANGENVVKSGNEAGSLPVTPESGTTDNIEFRDENSWKKGKRRVKSAAETLADLSVEHQEPFQLNQINMTQKNAENMDEKSRKRTKNSQNFAAKCLPDLTTEEQECGAEELTCPRDTHTEVGTSSKVRKKTKSVKTSSKYQLSGQELELGKNSGSEYGSVHPAQTLRAGELVEVPSADTHRGNFSGMPLRHDANGNALGNHSMNDANDQLEVSKSGANQVDFKDYFVRGVNKQEIAPVEKASKAERSVAEVKAKKLVEPSSASSPDIRDPLKPNENPGNKKKSLGRNYSSIQHEDSLVKDEHNMVELHSKSLDVPKNEIKARESHDIKHIKNTTQETKLSNVANGLKMSGYVPAYQKENSQSSDAANSSSESSRKYLQNKKETKRQSSLDSHVIVAKTSSRNRGEVVNSSRQERSLLATPGTIFRDGSSDSSEDENGAVNSDASTKTPSDNSSSSGYSEGETEAIQNSPRNGGGAKRKGGMMNSRNQLWLRN
ncbi:uncharacterized protein LOC127797337 isoform X2 [Diospyros lotus]|uniref:uncharacterized protein LOC127797337 isoform X2 n=1 Tax=Diospyros lotus TaxID=55363 RepID=UPI00225AD99D|nr:uncharacterized protein LOC127797337 isoform X2 [Diospyros lotus]